MAIIRQLSRRHGPLACVKVSAAKIRADHEGDRIVTVEFLKPTSDVCRPTGSIAVAPVENFSVENDDRLL